MKYVCMVLALSIGISLNAQEGAKKKVSVSKAELKAANNARFQEMLETRTQTKLRSSLLENARTVVAVNDVPQSVKNNFAANNKAVKNVTWTKENGSWYARYEKGGHAILNAYDDEGTQLYMATTIPYKQMPEPIVSFKKVSAVTLAEHDIVLLNVTGQAPVYQVTLTNGNLVYVNSNGTTVNDVSTAGLVIK